MTGKYGAYSDYKRSGVEWLGEVPEHWGVGRLGYYASLGTGATPDRSNSVYWGGDIPWIKTGEVKYNTILDSEEKITVEGAKNSAVQLSSPGTLLMAMYGQGVTRGRVAILGVAATYNQACAAINPNKRVWGEYLRYYFMAAYSAIRDGGNETSQMNLNADIVSRFKISIPTLSEQHIIVSHLDYETAKIEQLIAKQERLIELLKEKRQAAISHAVTKGLNPDVKMKESGVDWLGDVPEHWSVCRLKHFGRVIGGYAFKSGDFVDSGYPVIKISNVSHLSFDWGDSSFLPEVFANTQQEYIAPKGSLIFAMTRPVISGGIKVAQLDEEESPLINQRVGFMKFNSSEHAIYVLMSTQSSPFLAQFVNNMTVTNQPNISSEGIESIALPVPPDEELRIILDKLAQMIEKYGELLDNASKQIELLKERRIALISAAVTGKIDVRDWQSPVIALKQELQEETVAV